jgi:hypothetical protein
MPSILIVSKPLPDGTVKELFVGAVTSDSAAAALLVKKLEPGPRVVLIKSKDSISWPIFVLEESSGFSILGLAEVRARIVELLERRPPAPRGEDYFLANLYFVSQQFVPQDIFRDSMGRISHLHLSDIGLDEFEKWIRRVES